MRIIIDSRGTLPLSLRVIKTAHAVSTIVAVSSKISKSRRMKLESFGVNVIVAGKDKVSITLLLYKLWKIKINTVFFALDFTFAFDVFLILVAIVRIFHSNYIT